MHTIASFVSRSWRLQQRKWPKKCCLLSGAVNKASISPATALTCCQRTPPTYLWWLFLLPLQLVLLLLLAPFPRLWGRLTKRTHCALKLMAHMRAFAMFICHPLGDAHAQAQAHAHTYIYMWPRVGSFKFMCMLHLVKLWPAPNPCPSPTT